MSDGKKESKHMLPKRLSGGKGGCDKGEPLN